MPAHHPTRPTLRHPEPHLRPLNHDPRARPGSPFSRPAPRASPCPAPPPPAASFARTDLANPLLRYAFSASLSSSSHLWRRRPTTRALKPRDPPQLNRCLDPQPEPVRRPRHLRPEPPPTIPAKPANSTKQSLKAHPASKPTWRDTVRVVAFARTPHDTLLPPRPSRVSLPRTQSDSPEVWSQPRRGSRRLIPQPCPAHRPTIEP